MTEMIQPKVCAVCGRVLDLIDGQWMHTAEWVGKKDHVSVPVDYADVPVRCMCDFCFTEVPPGAIWTVVANDFDAPLIPSRSMGGWAACKPCADIAERRDWPAMIQRHFDSPASSSPDRPEVRGWLLALYRTLEANMIEVRPWQAGDEKVASA